MRLFCFASKSQDNATCKYSTISYLDLPRNIIYILAILHANITEKRKLSKFKIETFKYLSELVIFTTKLVGRCDLATVFVVMNFIVFR